MSAAEDALLGAVTRAGETVLVSLPLTGGVLGGGGALAVSALSVWLAQPQLLGGASTASVPRTELRAASARRTRFGGHVLELELGGGRIRLGTRADAADVEELLRVLDVPRG
ncbi:hypothetical protein [Kineococcus aurantiacus]|uniref:PH domain-containing protein n=1 Tax=Kineococcus aurantiacus TaxID=37633 RepID=A0A7Y9DND2_9ACTN|nr:hypothetical protein [Kineococcus aurantiacus]NYD23801.1 hypothetical protein [Kineococcus aurantiacus]